MELDYCHMCDAKGEMTEVHLKIAGGESLIKMACLECVKYMGLL